MPQALKQYAHGADELATGQVHTNAGVRTIAEGHVLTGVGPIMAEFAGIISPEGFVPIA
ncbi:hypothetical protein D3C73_1633340 [compost metagenome]